MLSTILHWLKKLVCFIPLAILTFITVAGKRYFQPIRRSEDVKQDISGASNALNVAIMSEFLRRTKAK